MAKIHFMGCNSCQNVFAFLLKNQIIRLHLFFVHRWSQNTYEEELQHGNRLRTVSKNLLWVLHQVYSHKTSLFILMQLQITSICLVCIGALYLITESSQCNTYNRPLHCDEAKQSAQWRQFTLFFKVKECLKPALRCGILSVLYFTYHLRIYVR